MVRVLAFLFLATISVSVYAQPGGSGPVRVGCWRDTMRNCGFMAAAAPDMPPFLPCPEWKCEELGPFGMTCEEPKGLTVTDWNTMFHDIQHVTEWEAGRTSVDTLIDPIPCGNVNMCKCQDIPAGQPCGIGAFLYGYKPIQYSTFGPIDCFGTPGGGYGLY